MSAPSRRSERELLEWNRRQAEVVAGFAERYERTTVPSRRAGSAALNRSPYYVPAEEPAEGSARFDAYAGPKAQARLSAWAFEKRVCKLISKLSLSTQPEHARQEAREEGAVGLGIGH